MNHDATHCLDWTEKCPAWCNRANLTKDFEENKEAFIGVPMSWARYKDTPECELDNTHGMRRCPFCGGKVTITYNSAEGAYNIWHSGTEDCAVAEPISLYAPKTLGEAIAAWNRRTE